MNTLTQKEFEEQKGHYSRLRLIKTDKNGSQYYEGFCPCPRCSGVGIVYKMVLNGEPIPHTPEGGRCFKCNGERVIPGKVKVITEEYAKVLEAKRIDKRIKTAEEAQKKMEEAKQRLIERNTALGYKEIDFELASWFAAGQIHTFNLYRIAYETPRAYLLSLTNFLDISTTDMYEIWVPKSAIIFKTKGGKK